MSRMCLIVAGAVLACGVAIVAREAQPAQVLERVSEQQAREWATYAVSKANGDTDAFNKVFTSLVRIFATTYRVDPFYTDLILFNEKGVTITLNGQVSQFQTMTAEYLRRMLPIESVPWPCGATIDVLPRELGALDIERIVVRRNGRVVAPLADWLTPTPLTTRAGVSFIVHAGSVCYSPATFDPSGVVVVTAIPVVGRNLVRDVIPEELRMLM